MASTDQPLLDLTDKETLEKLSLWDRRTDAMAPLTEKQMDSVLEIRTAAETLSVPSELPIEDLCSLSSRSLQSPFTATVPASTEDILLKGFQMIGMENDRIETAQQFFAWFAKLQANMDLDESIKYRRTRDDLNCSQEQCDAILKDVGVALAHLDSLQKQYLFVSNKTGALHEACEQLLKEQSELVDLAESIQQKLSYFNELENINTKLNSPTLSVNNEGFIPMLSKLDDCVEYVSSHPNFKDYPVYLSKFKQCLSKAMHFMKVYIVNTMQSLTSQLTKRLCSILKNEMLEDHVHNNAAQLGAFDAVVKQMLEDVQERLVYRTHIYIQTDIIGYNPAPGDLAYPEKLEMMERIAQSLKEEQLKQTSQEPSFSDVQLDDAEARRNSNAGSLEASRLHTSVSPADLHGMWYPTVRRTLVCLSKLYRCIDKAVFQGLSQEALSACIQSLLKASDIILKNKTQIDGQLFLIKHLLIMREQIAPFHTDFAIKEISLDLKKTRDAAFKILNPKAVPKFFQLNSHNAILEFLLEGTPEIKEHYIDSKKDVDRHLKFSCEQFIQQQTQIFVGNLEEFLTKVAALKTMVVQGGPTYSLSQQPWAQPAKINDVVMATYRVMKSKLPSTLQSMSLYLANRDTEFILFKPVRNNIQQVFQRLHALLQEEYSGEDLQIIACPSMEQINLLLSVNK
uniref:Conserved oligomeric Golgi complex subunit 3 n=1 Tax=Nothobranchius kadleci TaxID=1051664 RepID=A0A1A8C3B5_NOTKA